MQYELAKASDQFELARVVKAWQEEGWKPQGGVCVVAGSNITFYQAMVREGE